ncbi:hypothetical protein [Mesorhizobium sp. f-mel]
MNLEQTYKDIVRRYADDLSMARADALRWWNNLVGKEAVAGTDRQSAEHRCRMRWPMGPASHPRIIAVYRIYFFEIAQINENFVLEYESLTDGDQFSDISFWEHKVESEDQLYICDPTALLYESLQEIDEDLFSFMKSFVFMPIGMDPAGLLK